MLDVHGAMTDELPMYHLDLLQIADSAFPSGAFVHSSGLESLAPRTTSELAALLRLRIQQSLARLDLVYLFAAYQNEYERESLDALDARLHATLLPREAREASSQVGTHLLRGVCELVPNPRLHHFRDNGTFHHLPIVFGAVARCLDIPPLLAAHTYAFQQLRGIVSAAQRLMRLGQREAQSLLHQLKPDVRQAVETAQHIAVEEAGAFAPAWDIAAMCHERAAVRLFVS